MQQILVLLGPFASGRASVGLIFATASLVLLLLLLLLALLYFTLAVGGLDPLNGSLQHLGKVGDQAHVRVLGAEHRPVQKLAARHKLAARGVGDYETAGRGQPLAAVTIVRVYLPGNDCGDTCG